MLKEATLKAFLRFARENVVEVKHSAHHILIERADDHAKVLASLLNMQAPLRKHKSDGSHEFVVELRNHVSIVHQLVTDAKLTVDPFLMMVETHGAFFWRSLASRGSRSQWTL